jgi:HEAT repeat protein
MSATVVTWKDWLLDRLGFRLAPVKWEAVAEGMPLRQWGLWLGRGGGRGARAQLVLMNLGEQALLVFRTTLVDRRVQARLRAAEALSLLKKEEGDVLPDLLALLRDPSLEVRRAAMEGLRFRDCPFAELPTDALRDALAASPYHESLCKKAAEAACQLGPRAKELLPSLSRAALLDRSFYFQDVVMEGLDIIGRPAVPALAAVLLQGNESARPLVFEVLGKVGPPAAVAAAALVTVFPRLSTPEQKSWVDLVFELAPSRRPAPV